MSNFINNSNTEKDELNTLFKYLFPIVVQSNNEKRIFSSRYPTQVFTSLSLPQNVLFMNFTNVPIFQAMNMFDLEKQRDYNFLDCKELFVVCEIIRSQFLREKDRFVVLYYPERMDFISLLVSCFLAYNGDTYSPIEVYSEIMMELYGNIPSPFAASLKRYCGYFHGLLHSPIPDPISTKLEYITLNHYDEQMFVKPPSYTESDEENYDDYEVEQSTNNMIGSSPLFIIRGRSPIRGEIDDFCVSPKAKPWFVKKNSNPGAPFERIGNRFDIRCEHLIGDFVIDCYFPIRKLGRLEYQRAFCYSMNNTLSFGAETITVTHKELDCAELISDSFVMHLHFKRDVYKSRETTLNMRILNPEELKYVTTLEELVYTSPASYLRDPKMRHYMRLQSLNPLPSKKIEAIKIELNKEFYRVYPSIKERIEKKYQAEKNTRTILKSSGSDGTILKYLDDLYDFKTHLESTKISFSDFESEEFVTEDYDGSIPLTQSNIQTNYTISQSIQPEFSKINTNLQQEKLSTTEITSDQIDIVPILPISPIGDIPPPPPLPIMSGIDIPPPPMNGLPPPINGIPPLPNLILGPTPNNVNKSEFKNFQWDIIPSNRAMISIWKNFSKYNINMDELKYYFKKIPQQKKQVVIVENSKVISILGTERCRNIEIIAGQFKQFSDFTIQVPDYLNKLQEDKLNESQLTSLKQCIVSERELLQLREAKLDQISKGDLIALKISNVPRIQEKLETMLHMKSFPGKIEDLHYFLKIKLNAYRSLISSKMFHKILEVLLSLGNALNEGNKRLGNANGFAFSTLSKVHFLKSNEGNISLLQYLCILLKRDGFTIDNFKQELEDFFKGQEIESNLIEILETDINNISDYFRLENELCKNEMDVYREKVRLFSEYATSQQEILSKFLDRFKKDYQILLSHFGEQYKKEEEFLQPIYEFINIFQQSWIDLEMKESRKKHTSSTNSLANSSTNT